MKNQKELIDTYEKAEAYIFGIPKFTTKNEPQKTRDFYEELGCPAETCKIVHVAGTNGKGSVCTYCSAILAAHGYSVGGFFSPHLVCMRERFRFNGRMIEEAEFLSVFQNVMRDLEQFQKKEGNELYHPTFFEILFFIGMKWFAKKNPDYLVLETGLGGLLDATNIIKKPEITIITKIGLDHQQYLGNTLEEIATQKAGIIKKSVPLIYWNFDERVSDVIKNTAKRQNSPAIPVGLEQITEVKINQNFIDFYVQYGYDKNVYAKETALSLPTVALYQTQNASEAFLAASVLLKDQFDPQCAVSALHRTTWEGRMEEVLPRFYVDGAHNEDGILAFIDTREKVGIGNDLLLFGANSDKDYASMICKLAAKDSYAMYVVTTLNNVRSAVGEQIKTIFKKYTDKPVFSFDSVDEAFRFCLEHQGQGCVYAVGSLYLVGEIKGLIKEE